MRLRAEGAYGPALREVLPALAAVVVILCAVVAGVAVGYRVAGIGVPIGVLAVLAVVTPTVMQPAPATGPPPPRFLHTRGTRGAGHPGSGPGRLPDAAPGRMAGAPAAQERGPRPGPRAGRPGAPSGGRLPARGRAAARRGHALAFGAYRRPRPPLRLVVHRGAFTRRDVQWARRQGGVRLIDGPCLRRWAHGTPLNELSGSP